MKVQQCVQALAGFIGVLVLPSTGLVAQPSKTASPQLVWKSESMFSGVGSARLFGDGSMIIADAGAREVYWLKPGDTAQKLGRTGAGPGEYQGPESVQYFPNGSALIVDTRLRRFSVLDSLGAFKRSIPFPPGTSGLTGRVSGDRAGHIWFLGTPASPLGPQQVALLRLDVANGRIDSLGVVAGTLLADVSAPPPGGLRSPQQRLSFMVVPYASKDGFASLSQNDAVILRGASKQLQWIDSAGRVVRSRGLPQPIEVEIPDAALNRVRPATLRKLVPERQLGYDVDLLVSAQNGDLWLPRVMPRDTTRTQWIVLPSQGNERTVTLPSRARLLAVQGSLMVVAERDDDDVELIAAYRLPK